MNACGCLLISTMIWKVPKSSATWAASPFQNLHTQQQSIIIPKRIKEVFIFSHMGIIRTSAKFKYHSETDKGSFHLQVRTQSIAESSSS
jgi:hypothetical protein